MRQSHVGDGKNFLIFIGTLRHRLHDVRDVVGIPSEVVFNIEVKALEFDILYWHRNCFSIDLLIKDARVTDTITFFQSVPAGMSSSVTR